MKLHTGFLMLGFGLATLCAHARGEALDWKRIQAIADESSKGTGGKFATPEEAADRFLAALEKEHPGLCRGHHFLMRRSGALDSQDVDGLHPRLVCYFKGKDQHTFMLAMKGDPSRKSYSDFEVLEYAPSGKPPGLFAMDPSERDFQSHRLTFRGEGYVDIEADGFKDMIHDSASRGACASCHAPREGYYPTPIFRPKFHAGAYGSVSDTIPKGTKEYDEWKQFQAKLASQDPAFRRYRALGLVDDPLYHSVEVPADPAKHVAAHLELTAHPNDQFVAEVHDITMARIMSFVRNVPHFDKFRYAFTAAILACPNYTGFFPRQLEKAHRERLLASVSERVKKEVGEGHELVAALEHDSQLSTESMLVFTVFASTGWEGYEIPAGKSVKDKREQRVKALYDPASAHWQYPVVARLRFLFDGMGIDPEANVVRRWSPFREGAGSGFLFGDGKPNGKSLKDLLPLIKPDLDKDLANLTGEPTPEACAKLKEKSLAALAATTENKSDDGAKSRTTTH